MKIKKFFICIVIITFLESLVFSLNSCKQEEVLPVFLRTDGYNIMKNNDIIQLKGVNAGGWLVQESWMCPTELTCQKDMLSTLTNRFGAKRAKELLNIYLDNWWQDIDFDNIAALGFNTIRLPFTYLDMLDENYNLLADAFSRLDYFIENCKERDIYVILDMHGAVGSQNGKDHSGDTSGAFLFSNGNYKQATLNLWAAIAERYKDETVIAGFDLLNEPSESTGTTEFDYYDELYRAIRAVDVNHIIIMESVWEAYNLPDTDVYGWENVVYSYHNYCWDNIGDFNTMKSFIDLKLKLNKTFDHGVPILIGEFTAFDNSEDWEYTLDAYNNAGYSWTIWTYKVVGKGSTWGIYTADIEKVDLDSDSYEIIAAKWRNSATAVSFEKNGFFDSILDKE